MTDLAHNEERQNQLNLLREIVGELEWSDSRTGQDTGSGLHNGTYYHNAACPACGGIAPDHPYLGEHYSGFEPGHYSGCRIALALGRPTHIREGETGRLSL